MVLARLLKKSSHERHLPLERSLTYSLLFETESSRDGEIRCTVVPWLPLDLAAGLLSETLDRPCRLCLGWNRAARVRRCDERPPFKRLFAFAALVEPEGCRLVQIA